MANPLIGWRTATAVFLFALGLLPVALGHGATASRIQLAPHFTPGETLRYQIDFRTTVKGRNSGPIENPNAASQLELSASTVVRIEVLAVEAGNRDERTAGERPAPASIRMRATYEKVSAEVHSDSFNPQASALEQQYRQLAGRSLEFTLGHDGRLADVHGLQELFPDQRAASDARRWLSSLALPASLPPKGIAIGDKWSNDLPVTLAPLAGLVLRSRSTYVRNESCHPPPLAPAGAGDEACAVIATEFQTDRRHMPRDPTPEDYRRKDLRTSGRLSSSGESFSFISLRTGWLMSANSRTSEDMDITISAAQAGSKVRYTSELHGETQITLLEDIPPAAHGSARERNNSRELN